MKIISGIFYFFFINKINLIAKYYFKIFILILNSIAFFYNIYSSGKTFVISKSHAFISK